MAGEPLITVVGNIVADPELRTSQAGKPWVTFRMASTPRVRDRQSNDWTDGEPLWIGCRAYGEYAEHIAQSLTKGTRVLVQGRLTQRTYTDNQGQQRTSLDLEVEEIGPSLRFATAQVTRGGSGGGGAAASYYGGGQQQSAAAAYGGQQQQAQGSWGQQAQSQPGWGQSAVPQQQQQAPPAQGWGQQPPPAQQQDNPWMNPDGAAAGASGFDGGTF